MSIREELINDINKLPEQIIRAISVVVKEFALLNDSKASKSGQVLKQDRTEIRTAMFGCLRGKYIIADDFDAPLDDFKEYIP